MKVSEAMNFLTPMPFAKEYPLTLNSWVPTTVSVSEVDNNEEVDGEGGSWDTNDVVDGFGRKPCGLRLCCIFGLIWYFGALGFEDFAGFEKMVILRFLIFGF